MIYVFKCKHCRTEKEVVRPMADAHKRQKCDCGKYMQRVYGGLEPKHINSGKGWKIPGLCTQLPGNPYIKNKHHLREECKRHDLTPVGLD